jgi:hypothetical protein
MKINPETLSCGAWCGPLAGLSAIFFGTVLTAWCQPAITRQPTNQSVSLGANVSFQVFGTTANPPLTYQWRLGGTNLSSATNSSLSLISIQLTNAGGYDVVLADSAGSITSRVATSQVDPTLGKRAAANDNNASHGSPDPRML